jgi:hypothetical protein
MGQLDWINWQLTQLDWMSDQLLASLISHNLKQQPNLEPSLRKCNARILLHICSDHLTESEERSVNDLGKCATKLELDEGAFVV